MPTPVIVLAVLAVSVVVVAMITDLLARSASVLAVRLHERREL